MRIRHLLVAVFALAATAGVFAQGSFSLKWEPLDNLRVSGVLEQRVRQVDDWNVYAGVGGEVSLEGINRFEPYTIVCREDDVILAYTEICIEGGFNLSDMTGSLVVYTTIVW